jgi:hypothetical protein
MEKDCWGKPIHTKVLVVSEEAQSSPVRKHLSFRIFGDRYSCNAGHLQWYTRSQAQLPKGIAWGKQCLLGLPQFSMVESLYTSPALDKPRVGFHPRVASILPSTWFRGWLVSQDWLCLISSCPQKLVRTWPIASGWEHVGFCEVLHTHSVKCPDRKKIGIFSAF